MSYMSTDLKDTKSRTEARYTIPNLANACRALRLLGGHEEGLNMTAIREALEVPHTSALRILRTLESEGFVQSKGRNFLLGPAFLEMGASHFASFNLRKAALPALQQLVDKTGETAHFCVPSGYQSLILEVVESPEPVRVASRPGTLADIHCSATGKVFLAYLFRDEFDEFLSYQALTKRTANTLVSSEALEAELDQVDRLGYAVDDEEYHPGVRCLAAPVRNIEDLVVGSIGITASTQRFSKKMIPLIADKVKAVAESMRLP